ncbi:MAG: hypothetical protein WAV31_02310 [Candidatus Moraniibacteriota bacterium]
MRKVRIVISVLLVVLVIFGVIVYSSRKKENSQSNEKIIKLTETQARVIAEKACIKGGEALGAGTYNENAKVWLFSANLNATREGCKSVCAVSEKTETAIINWQCAGSK